MAASGGYWLACAGKEIYARYPSTFNTYLGVPTWYINFSIAAGALWLVVWV